MSLNKKKYVTNKAEEATICGFPFHKLSQLRSLDYDGIMTVTKTLEKMINLEEFYKNRGNCVTITLEFILGYSGLLINNSDSNNPLISLFTLLKEIIAKMNHFQLHFNDIERILILLHNLLESAHQNVKLESVGVIIELIKLRNLNSSNLPSLSKLCFRVCESLENSCAMIPLCSAILQHNDTLNFDIALIINWIENECADYLEQETDPRMLKRIIFCLLYYYKIQKDCKIVTNKLKAYLSKICTYMKNAELRMVVEDLLLIFLDELYFTEITSVIERNAIVEEIRFLPNAYQEWPEVNGNVFLILAYLTLSYSRMLWSNEVVLTSLKRCLSRFSPLSTRIILRASAFLYPKITYNKKSSFCIAETNKILIDMLNNYKSLDKILTFDHLQMKWLLTSSNPTLKKRVLLYWIEVESVDEEILLILNEIDDGEFLIQLLVATSKSTVSLRLCRLLTKIKNNKKLQQKIGEMLPIVCHNPDIFSQMTRIANPLPSDPNDCLNYVKIAAACLPLLTNDESIQALCRYASILLNQMNTQAVTAQAKALLFFCQFGAVPFLVGKTTVQEDATALAAITLLRHLITNQIYANVVIPNTVVIEFPKLLKGSSERIVEGLKLCSVLLNRWGIQSLITISNKFLSLYHFIHTLIAEEETAKDAFVTLRLLLVCHNNLAFSQVTPLSLRLICEKDMDMKCLKAFKQFLSLWHKYVTQTPYVTIPEYVRKFLD